ncbi:MAG: hypothetical protein KIT34_00180 [Cyanobacteria bacterium TGS_CYA1]|nr:hypothetical protein [Cyanobacteria bacterium TGS_CYA1]
MLKTIAAVLISVLYTVLYNNLVICAEPSDKPMLSAKILTFNQKNLTKLNASKSNPFITIYDKHIVVSWNNSKTTKSIQPSELALTLSQIPEKHWPLGRAVGVMYCGISSSGSEVKKYRQDAWKSVETTLKEMKIYLNACPCA